MKRFVSEIMTTAAVATLLLASCSKDTELGDNILNFTSGVAGIEEVKSGYCGIESAASPMEFVSYAMTETGKALQMEMTVESNTSVSVKDTYASCDTKASLYTDTAVSPFSVAGYNGSTKWFPESESSQSVTDGQSFSGYTWLDGTVYSFYAYANISSGMTATISSSGVSLNATIADTASGQSDPLLGIYSGNGNSIGQAAMTFYHPMTAIIFKLGGFNSSLTKIDKISIGGVHGSGSTVLNTNNISGDTASFTWDTAESSKISVRQTLNMDPVSGQLGEPFVLIPQNLSTDQVVVRMFVTYDGEDLQFVSTFNTGSWEAGKTYTYVANFTQPLDEIWYTSYDGNIVTKSTDLDVGDFSKKTYTELFGAELISNTYKNGKGIMKFDAPITDIGDYAFRAFNYSDAPESNIHNLVTISFPEGITEITGQSVFTFSGAGAAHHNRTKWRLSEVTLPASIQSIKARFMNNSNAPTIRVGAEGPTYECSYSNTGQYPEIIFPGGAVVKYFHMCCFVKGTLITMADGSKKLVEELEYGDVLKVWNFDEGHEDVADILWITKRGLTVPYYFKCTFSDGTVLNVVGEDGGGTHRIFDTTKGSFEHPHTIPVDDEIYTDNGLVKLVSYERIDEEVEYFNLITTKHINCYANDVLTSARYNNRWPIDEDMKFVKDGRKIRPYREFKKAGISREWYNGMRLGEQQDSIARVKAYIDRCEYNTRPRPESDAPQGFFARIWNNIKTWWKSIFG